MTMTMGRFQGRRARDRFCFGSRLFRLDCSTRLGGELHTVRIVLKYNISYEHTLSFLAIVFELILVLFNQLLVE
jgi:hypothetical protein